MGIGNALLIELKEKKIEIRINFKNTSLPPNSLWRREHICPEERTKIVEKNPRNIPKHHQEISSTSGFISQWKEKMRKKFWTQNIEGPTEVIFKQVNYYIWKQFKRFLNKDYLIKKGITVPNNVYFCLSFQTKLKINIAEAIYCSLETNNALGNRKIFFYANNFKLILHHLAELLLHKIRISISTKNSIII